MNRKTALTLIPLLCISLLSIVGYMPKALGQTGTNVSSQIITQNTTWTQAGSPYTLMGPVDVANGVTLTIDAGVTANLGNYYLEVNGTLHALGTSTDNVCFNDGVVGESVSGEYAITFTPFSSSWNEQTGKGCIIEYAFLNSTSILINSSSPEIKDNTIQGSITTEGNGAISIIGNTINGLIMVNQGSTGPTVIFNNTITGGGIDTGGQDITISNNYISTPIYTGIDCGFSTGIVSNNVVTGCYNGIWTQGSSSPVITRNLVTGSKQYGMVLDAPSTIAQNNTVTNNAIGIRIDSSFPTVTYNNIYSNTQYNIYSNSQDNGNIPDNWWGTTNQQAINQTIHDSKDDFNLGTVNFVPFLTAQNPQATPNPNAPIPSPSSSNSNQTSTQPSNQPEQLSTTKSSINWTQTALFAAVAVIAALVIAVVALARGRKAAVKNSCLVGAPVSGQCVQRLIKQVVGWGNVDFHTQFPKSLSSGWTDGDSGHFIVDYAFSGFSKGS